MSEKASAASMRELVALVAGPRSWADTRESWLARAARRAGISYRQTKSLFYGEITDPHHRSARLMRDAAEELAQRYAAITNNPANPVLSSADRAALIELVSALRDISRS